MIEKFNLIPFENSHNESIKKGSLILTKEEINSTLIKTEADNNFDLIFYKCYDFICQYIVDMNFSKYIFEDIFEILRHLLPNAIDATIDTVAPYLELKVQKNQDNLVFELINNGKKIMDSNFAKKDMYQFTHPTRHISGIISYKKDKNIHGGLGIGLEIARQRANNENNTLYYGGNDSGYTRVGCVIYFENNLYTKN
jgi:Histidine kinase-, DNA gyrase B-, and HSP90-like ATPase